HQLCRQKGIATHLLDTAIRDLPTHVNSVVLEVRSQNTPAIRMYEKMGFVKLGLRKGFYSTPADDAIVMELSKGGVKALD
ncbi:MAG: GNAT family N-acetyltransferase, partial [Oscillospiraceae bacterium]|nr:GNAT family N-acetyltransferase [Oscillospiraceae bacterium]